MSGHEAVQAAAVAALCAALGEAAVFDAPPVRSALPHVVVEPPLLVDWSAKDWRGREGRLTVSATDRGERPARLRDMAGAIEDAVEGMPADLGEGWRLVSARLTRSRIARAGNDRWVATSEFVVRIYREN
ncbi:MULTISPECIES: DUF3168 domain-containing protein [unclassified Sphingomonas]|uniref:DUF3168 domain-containing protein n=1 Tax=unclassified Sphingomonas TaxID=196159 RepID=UPI00092C0251|nr:MULTISPECIES: DUF3168 domain-containing protein [unclassified Sphingomonas]MBN8849466.1 DUF3168 domain-containing protein [Sphingomonas sp.]OJV34516.1 MAG: hypothetical protein BGO24_12660 [Sphingomonas sp. 67-36]